MHRLQNSGHISYDSMIIIYYCFNVKNHKLIEYTDKAHTLTEFLIKKNVEIVVPSFLIDEIRRKNINEMITTFVSSSQITNLPKNPNFAFKLGLEVKFKQKLNNLLKKEWFTVVDYIPPTELLKPLNRFFEEVIQHPKFDEFTKKKKRDTTIPSFEDLGLMIFSKDKKQPIISNDNDLTFFADELFEKNLTDKIFNFNDLDIYNN